MPTSSSPAGGSASLRFEPPVASAVSDPTESEHDAFYTGHSSTSISAALGMAVARDRTGGRGTVVAVIGDGARQAAWPSRR